MRLNFSMVPLYPIGKGFFLTYFLIYAKHRSVPLNQGVKVKSEFLVAVLTVEGPFTRVDTLVVFKLILLVASASASDDLSGTAMQNSPCTST